MRPNKAAASERQLKVAELIKISLADAITKGKVKDLRLSSNSVTITKVEVSGDLKVATCYVIPFGSSYSAEIKTKLSAKELLDALEESKYGLRAWVTKNVALKYSPEIRFAYDHGFENASIVEQLLQNNASNDED
ncbi:MAG: 30S ribosome-binding factor RbfA [Pseudomonadota bacterium]